MNWLRKFSGWVRQATRQLFTEPDNTTLCPVRVFGIPFAFVATVVYFGLSIYTVVAKGNALDYMSFAGGVSTIWGVVSLAVIGQTAIRRQS